MLDRIQNPMHFRNDKFTLKLSSEECNLLISLLSSAISDTRGEINQTDKYELSDEMKSELLMMEKILASIIDTSMMGNRPPTSIH